MKNVPALPWWGWSIAAFVVLNVILNMDVSIFFLLLIGLGLGAMLGTGSGSRKAGPTGAVPGGTGSRQLPPSSQPGPGAGGTGEQGATPADASPWHTTGQSPGPAPQPPDTPSMPRIEVPGYPGGGGTAYPSTGQSQPTDPVVSLGQLQLSRCSRDLHIAATTGSTTEVGRVLTEIDGEAGRLLTQLAGSGRSGRGHRELITGLRSLQRDVAAARDEDPPGAKVARVVRASGAMGQTGRYE